MIISHESSDYINLWSNAGMGRYNGAYYYSKEIVENIIPNVNTDRNWVTIMVSGMCFPHSIFFVHNNLHPQRYEWLRRFEDVVLVCGVEGTVRRVQHIGKPIYLPLSVDVEYVEQFKCEKTRDVAFAGRLSKKRGVILPAGVDTICGMPREKLLENMAKYKNIYAVGRTAIEAKILGCNVLPLSLIHI